MGFQNQRGDDLKENQILVDQNNHIISPGGLIGGVEFDPGLDTSLMYHQGSGGDAFIQELDSSGNYVWHGKFAGPGWEDSKSIFVDEAGNRYTTGIFYNEFGLVDFDPGPGQCYLSNLGSDDAQVFISKVDANGNCVWVKGIGTHSDECSYGIVADNEGNVYICGEFFSPVDFDPDTGDYHVFGAGESDVFILKLDASGNFVWAKQFGGSGLDAVYDMAIDNENNIYCTGYFTGTADFDPGTGIANLTSVKDSDIFVLKIDSAGSYLWAGGMGGTFRDMGYSIVLDDSANVYTTGTFGGTADFDPGPDSSMLTGRGGFDAFIQKMDSSGNFIWARNVGSRTV